MLDLVKAGETKRLYKERAATGQQAAEALLRTGTAHLQSAAVSRAAHHPGKMAPVAGKKAKRVSLQGA